MKVCCGKKGGTAAAVALILATGASLSSAWAQSTTYPEPMGHMMMGGMMGSGMMRRPGITGPDTNGSATSAGGATSTASRALEAYVGYHNLSCFSCHAISGQGMGPSFTEIAQRYAGQTDAQSVLSGSIAGGVSGKWSGYRTMPGGLASPAQARELARLILSLGANN